MKRSKTFTCLSLMGLMLIAGSALSADVTCIPAEVAQIDSRVHVRCEQPIFDGVASISYFALPAMGSGDIVSTASRFTAMGMTAITSAKRLIIWFNAGDINGASYGCGANDCRRPTAFFLLK